MKKHTVFAGIATIVAMGTLIVSSASAANQDPILREGQRPVVTEGAPVSPISGQNTPESFQARVSQDRAIMLPHPPIDQIPWLPMPEPIAPGIRTGIGGGESTITTHDALTGETRQLPLRLSETNTVGGESVEGDYPGFGNMIDNSDEMGRSFGTMTLAGALDTWPRSGNVKLVIKYTDINGAAAWFVCSGSMQDSGVILTAAHCVFNRDPNINSFADIIYVYPAWDGVGDLFAGTDSAAIVQNFGYAYGTSFAAGTNYINNGDWDADIGLIRLSRGSSRSVGMLTGWFGWRWGDSCATIQSRTYNNFSYPAENCPTPGMHTGTDMYYWSGTIDSCPGNQMRLNTGGNCLDTLWGGMSGSGMYYINSGSRYVHSVASTSNRFDVGNYCKLWESMVIEMQAFENTTRGSTFDLEALKFRAGGSTTVVQGQPLDAGATAAIANATNNNPVAGSYTLRVYLSANNNISEFDTLLATWNYNTDFAAMQTKTFNVPAPTIPLNTPPGDYFIGVVLDSGTDTVSLNNDTDTWDAQQITVLQAFPDLEATQCDATAGTYYQGQSVSVTHRTYNYGTGPTGNVHLEFRASTNNFISTFDTLMEDRVYGSLTPGADHWFISSVQIPADLNPGTYFIGTIVDDLSGNETNLSNNWVSDIDTIIVLDCPPDLTGDGLVNFFDVAAFLAAFSSQSPAADFNNDGLYNFFDVAAFLAAFSVGCP